MYLYANAQKLYFRFVKVWTLVPTPSIPFGPPFIILYFAPPPPVIVSQGLLFCGLFVASIHKLHIFFMCTGNYLSHDIDIQDT
jgi:hypothetical protein